MLKRRYDEFGKSENVFQEEKLYKRAKKSIDLSLDVLVPRWQKALVVESFESELSPASNIAVTQHLGEYEILIKNKFVGLNHVDWKSKKYKFNIYSFPWINGRESSGIVVGFGEKVEKTKFPLGAEVFLASTSYRDLRTSTFQEYTVFDSRLVWRIPQIKLADGVFAKKFDLDFAAGIGVGLVTAGSAISHFIDLHHDDCAPLGDLVIWGGTSSVGIYTIQLAKASGKFRKILVIAAKKHNKYLRRLGASHVIDRHLSEEEISEELLKNCPEGVNQGIDVVSKKTATVLSNILQKKSKVEKKLVCVVETPELATTNIEVGSKSKLIIEKVSIKKFHEDLEYGHSFVEYTSRLFEEGYLEPIQALKVFKVMGNFGEGIKNGLEELEIKKPSAEKYVASI